MLSLRKQKDSEDRAMKYWAIYGVFVFILLTADMALSIFLGASGVEMEPRLPLEYILTRELFYGR
jgi:hypothetical protein